MTEQSSRPINFFALSPHELIANGSGFDVADYRGEKILVNAGNLIELRDSRAFYINEDFFQPIGLLTGDITPERVLTERNRVKRVGGFTTFALFNERAADLYFGAEGSDEKRGFYPTFPLAKFDPINGIKDEVLHFGLVNEDPSKLPTEADFDMLQLVEGYKRVYAREFNKATQTVDISVLVSAMHADVEYYLT